MLGWDSHNFILIMGSFFTLWVAYFIRMGYLAAFKSYIIFARANKKIDKQRYKQLKKYQIQRQNRVFWSNFILLVLMSYYEILIGGILNLQLSLTHYSGDRFAALLTPVFLVLALMIIPRISLYILSKDLDWFQRDPETRLAYTHQYYWFQRKLRMFWWRQPTHNKIELSWSVFFMLRRVIFVYLVFVHGVGTQIIGNAFYFGFISLYTAEYRPKKTYYEWCLEMWNEYWICGIHLHYALMTDYVIDPDQRYTIGWSLNIHIAMLLLQNFLVMAYFAIRFTILIIKKIYWWIVLSRIRMNRKYLRFRNLEMEQIPHVSCTHVCTRHFIFGSRFFRQPKEI